MLFMDFKYLVLDLGSIAFLATYKDNLILVRPHKGEGNGNPLQYFCLEDPRDGGAWWAAVYGVAQCWTRLKRLSSSSRPHKTHREGIVITRELNVS